MLDWKVENRIKVGHTPDFHPQLAIPMAFDDFAKKFSTDKQRKSNCDVYNSSEA